MNYSTTTMRLPTYSSRWTFTYLSNRTIIVLNEGYEMKTIKETMSLIKNLNQGKSVAYSSHGSHTGQLDFCN
jgi:hypothetical protein